MKPLFDKKYAVVTFSFKKVTRTVLMDKDFYDFNKNLYPREFKVIIHYKSDDYNEAKNEFSKIFDLYENKYKNMSLLKRIVCLFRGHEWDHYPEYDEWPEITICVRCGKIKEVKI